MSRLTRSTLTEPAAAKTSYIVPAQSFLIFPNLSVRHCASIAVYEQSLSSRIYCGRGTGKNFITRGLQCPGSGGQKSDKPKANDK